MSQSVVGATLLFLYSPPSGCSKVSGPTAAPSDPTFYVVHARLHGHSNHSGNDLPASRESRSSETGKHDFEVIQSTDHAYLFRGYVTALGNGTSIRLNVDSVLPHGFASPGGKDQFSCDSDRLLGVTCQWSLRNRWVR